MTKKHPQSDNLDDQDLSLGSDQPSDQFDHGTTSPTNDSQISDDLDQADLAFDATEEDHYQDLAQQIADLTDALQRERADVSNIRRRHEEQIANLKDAVKTDIVRQLLPVIDSFERALKHVPKELQANDYVKGVQAVVKQFEKTLADLGVQKIKTVGEPFDPQLHEAVSAEEGEGTQEIVSEELQSGYTISGQVVRHAMVRVKNA